MNIPPPTLSRRHFLRTGSASLVAPAIITAATTLRAQQKADSNETLRIGLIGCGGRGTGAASQALQADYNARLVAVADVSEKQMDISIASLSVKTPDRVTVSPEHRFVGLDAYQKLLASEVDVVILATPPGYRPLHLTAAVEAGKHLFCEKPMAVDAVGYHMAMAALTKAKEKKLNVTAGFCWRYNTSRRESFKRLKDGQFGDLMSYFGTYYGGPIRLVPAASSRQPDQTDLAWQLASWNSFSWLSGDNYVEQAVHSVDKLMWAVGDQPPVSCTATGGRQTPAEGGNIFDHFHVAYEFANGVMGHIGSRQMTGCANENIDYVQCSEAKLVIGKGSAPFAEGTKRWRFRGEEKNMYQIEHDELFAAICRTESGNRNYVFTTSKDGKTWTQGEPRPFVSKGSNSKPTFDKFNGIYYLGWQEATRITDGHGVGRYIFNIEVSRDGVNWERKYRFESPNSFQYPTFRQHEGSIWFTVTQGTGGSTDRIMFGKLESSKPAPQLQPNNTTNDASTAPSPSWEQIRRVPMSGGLRAFWNVAGGDNATNYREAAAHGFEMVDLLSTYSDYPGRQKENIRKTLDANKTNPWQKPDFFERIVKRNIEKRGNQNAIFVHDIEFSFEEDIDKVWADPVIRVASKATTREQFADAYLREWATWFTLPCQWAKERFPGTPIGIYGPQPFRRDYFGISGKFAQQIDGTHHSDADLWQHIDPFVDYYIASIYVFYDKPDSIYYMAANVEENIERTRRYGSKPLYAYEWLRYHDSNKKLAGQEVAPWLAEAMAVLPYFCGARGLALWGSEPKRQGQYYHTLPVFTASLGRVSDLSAKIAAAKLMPDEPAHVLWKTKRPLVRRMRVSADEWIVLAVNPWQAEDATSTVAVPLENGSVDLEVRGRHTDIFHCMGSNVKRL